MISGDGDLELYTMIFSEVATAQTMWYGRLNMLKSSGLRLKSLGQKRTKIAGFDFIGKHSDGVTRFTLVKPKTQFIGAVSEVVWYWEAGTKKNDPSGDQSGLLKKL